MAADPKLPGMQRADMAVQMGMDVAGLWKTLRTCTIKDELVATLLALGRRGEQSAATFGYAGAVAEMLSHPEPEVVAAACEALPGMGMHANQYAGQVAALLRDQHGGSPRGALVRAAAAGALGMLGESADGFEPDLLRLVDDEEDSVKAAGLTALGQIGAEEQADRIAGFLTHKSSVVAAAACLALGSLDAGEAHLAEIAARLDDPVSRWAALSALLNHEEEKVSPHAETIISRGLKEEGDSTTRLMAASLLGTMEPGKWCSELAELLQHAEPGVRCSAALAFGYIGRKATGYVSQVEALLQDEQEDESELYLVMGGGKARSPPVSRRPKCAALVALGMMGAVDAREGIAEALADANWEVRMCALEAFGALGEEAKDWSGKVTDCLEDPVYVVRAKACDCLAAMGAEEQMDSLPELLDDKAPSVKIAALNALSLFPGVAASFSGEVFKCMTEAQPSQVQAAAIHALGCMGEAGQSYASAIATALSSEEPQVRAEACVALAKLSEYGLAFKEDVWHVMEEDPDAGVRTYAEEALADMDASADEKRAVKDTGREDISGREEE